VVVSLEDGGIVDWAAGAAYSGGAASSGYKSITQLAQGCGGTVAWWAPDTLAVSSPAGVLGLGSLPGLEDVLGMPGDTTSSTPHRCAPGEAAAGSYRHAFHNIFQ
jgi:hypothetical protein